MQKSLLTLLFCSLTVLAQAQDGSFHLDKEYKMKKNGIIDLSSSDANVFITGSNRETAHVKIDRKITTKGWAWGEDNFRVDIKEEEGDLKIYEKQNNTSVSIVGYYNEDYKIEIEAPEGASLTIRGDDGDYLIKNVNGTISLNIDDADAELIDCGGDKFSFRIDDGDIRMNSGKGSLEISADDADIEIHDANFKSIHADLDDGDLIIDTSLDNNGDYNLKSEDGSIVLNITGGGGEFDIRHDDGHVIADGSFKTLDEDEDRTRLSLDNGSANVTMRTDDARIRLTRKSN